MSRKELYSFSHGSKNWYFTSSSKKVVHNGIEYLPVRGLGRGNIEDADLDKCEIDIVFPQPMPIRNAENDDFSQVFINKIYFESVYLTIIELYRDEPLVLFKGRVTQPKFDESAHTMTLVCSTAESYQRRNILTRKFQRNCANKIYDRFCGLKIEDWAQEATVTAVNGLSVTFTLNDPNFVLESGYFTRGLLLKDGLETFIQEHAGTLQLYREHQGLAVGDLVLLAPGCDQSVSLCNSRFNNHLRYHGFPNMPTENPVNQQIVR